MSVRSQRAALRQFLQRWRWNSNNGAAMLLAVAALGTAWSSYQASLWGGIQASSYTRSMAYRSRAARASGEAAQDRLLDVALFTRWFEASLDRNPRIVSIYETHFRPSFRDAFDAWRHGNAGLADSVTPFDLPEYHSVKATEAERAEAESMRALEQGERANDTSNIY